jgi:hypothetical protein
VEEKMEGHLAGKLGTKDEEKYQKASSTESWEVMMTSAGTGCSSSRYCFAFRWYCFLVQSFRIFGTAFFGYSVQRFSDIWYLVVCLFVCLFVWVVVVVVLLMVMDASFQAPPAGLEPGSSQMMMNTV